MVASENNDKVSIPNGWQMQTVTLRDWWVPDKCNLFRDSSCVGKFVKYFLFRQTWNEKGGYDIYVYSLPSS
jgi:hypothetical protein